MDQKDTFKGGYTVGWFSSRWSGATLKIDDTSVKLKVFIPGLKVFPLGEYVFDKDQLLKIEEKGSVPIFSSCIRFHHNILSYPEKLIFWPIGEKKEVIQALHSKGFRDTGTPLAERSFPFRIPALVMVVFLWNILLLHDLEHSFSGTSPDKPFFGVGSILALVMLLVVSVGIKKSEIIRHIFLNSGRDAGEVAYITNMLTFIASFLLLGFLGMMLCGL